MYLLLVTVSVSASSLWSCRVYWVSFVKLQYNGDINYTSSHLCILRYRNDTFINLLFLSFSMFVSFSLTPLFLPSDEDHKMKLVNSSLTCVFLHLLRLLGVHKKRPFYLSTVYQPEQIMLTNKSQNLSFSRSISQHGKSAAMFIFNIYSLKKLFPIFQCVN